MALASFHAPTPPPLPCNGASVVRPSGPFCAAIGPLLHGNQAPVAPQRGPHCAPVRPRLTAFFRTASLKQLKIKHLRKGLKTSKFPVIPDFIEFRASFGTVRVTQFRQKFFFGLKDRINWYDSCLIYGNELE